jgi:hypothetical protein
LQDQLKARIHEPHSRRYRVFRSVPPVIIFFYFYGDACSGSRGAAPADPNIVLRDDFFSSVAWRLFTAEDDPVAKCAHSVLERAIYSRPHILALEERGRDLVDDLIGATYTAVKIDSFAGRVGQGRTSLEPLGEGFGLRFEFVIRNNLVYDIPSLERCCIVLACDRWSSVPSWPTQAVI